MQFDVIDVPYLGAGINTTAYTSIDLLLDSSDDIVIMPDGTLGNVSGSLKLAQDIKLFLLSPLGSAILDPAWGNSAINLIGTAPLHNLAVEASIQGALQNLKRFKDNEEVSRGYPLEGSELISEIREVTLTVSDNADVYVAVITVSDKTSVLTTFQISLASNLNG